MAMSQSTLKVTAQPSSARGPSPTPDLRHRLQVPKSRGFSGKSDDSKNIWGEEEVELIKTCAILSSSLGLSKSLSTSDISMNDANRHMKPWVSEENLNGQADKLDGVFPQKLEPMSRSCSTWVAVGDVVSTSQLPSPQARLGGSDSPTITAVDFIRSVNKKVRQNYIQRRLQMSYRVLKRFPDYNINKETTGTGTGTTSTSNPQQPEITVLPPLPASACAPREVLRLIRREVDDTPVMGPGQPVPSLTARDVERDRGRQLSRYERNMIIFNWLQTLDGENFEALN